MSLFRHDQGHRHKISHCTHAHTYRHARAHAHKTHAIHGTTPNGFNRHKTLRCASPATDRRTHCATAYLVVTAEVNGNEGEPHDTRGVHGEADELGLVEVLRQVACLDGVQRTHDDEEDVEAKRNEDA